jgi:hypothetical protein
MFAQSWEDFLLTYHVKCYLDIHDALGLRLTKPIISEKIEIVYGYLVQIPKQKQ